MEGQKQQCDSLVEACFHLGIKYKHMANIIRMEYRVTVSERHIKRIFKKLGLCRRRYSDLEDVFHFIQQQLQGSGNLHGYRIMHTLCKENGLNVKKEDVRLILRELDPDGVQIRRSRHLKRREYYAKEPNFIWHIDGYDKLKPYGLCISGCIDGFSQKIIWLNVYKTNNDPKVIGGYFLESVKYYGGCPRIVRGDFGTENGYVCVFQEFLRRNATDSLARKAYMAGSSTSNQRIERWWGFLRKELTGFYMDLFKNMQEEGEYTGDSLDKALIQFYFMSLIQEELDKTAEVWNAHSIRPSRNDRVPSGRPNVMFYTPGLWTSEDKLYTVLDEEIDICCNEATFRSSISCDEEVYDICITMMKKYNLSLPKDHIESTDLYNLLRRTILDILL